MGSIYLSNLNIIPSNLKVVPVTLIAPLGSPKIIKSLFVMALLPKLGFGKSLSKSYKF
jgi:hypothetical protein